LNSQNPRTAPTLEAMSIRLHALAERGIDRILFYDAPTWVFTAAYVAFAALVAITWVAVPPSKSPRMR